MAKNVNDLRPDRFWRTTGPRRAPIDLHEHRLRRGLGAEARTAQERDQPEDVLEMRLVDVLESQGKLPLLADRSSSRPRAFVLAKE